MEIARSYSWVDDLLLLCSSADPEDRPLLVEEHRIVGTDPNPTAVPA